MKQLCPAGRLVIAWLAEHQRSQTWLADAIDVGRAQLWRYLVGRPIHVNYAAAIEQITGIPAAMWATNASLRPVDHAEQIAPSSAGGNFAAGENGAVTADHGAPGETSRTNEDS